MLRELRFYDDYTGAIASPWWMFCLLGLNLLVLGALILIFPELLAWLAAGFLFFNCVVLLLVAWRFWRFKRLTAVGVKRSGCRENQ